MPMRTRSVRAATAARKVIGDGFQASSEKWCSLAQTLSKPSSSASTASSRWSLYSSCNGCGWLGRLRDPHGHDELHAGLLRLLPSAGDRAPLRCQLLGPAQ